MSYEKGSADPPNFPNQATLALFVAVIGSFGCDVAFISMTRGLLRWAGKMTSSMKVLVTVIVNLLLAVTFITFGTLPALIARARNPEFNMETTAHIFLNGVLPIISISNLLDALLALLFVGMAVMLLVHRVIWPLLNRTLFRLQEVGTRGRRGILVAVGLALITWSGVRIPDMLRTLTHGLGQ